jgi:hypothetical protein
LGGRETEGFGFLDETLADIPVGGTVVLQDVVGEHWQASLGTLANLGAIVVFAYEAGTLDAATGRVFRNAIVTSRTYNETTIWVPDTANVGQYIEQDATYGQSIDGVPWYNMADAGAVSDIGDFSFQVLVGGADTDILRYNVGLFNASDQQTSVVLTLQPFQADGSPFLNDLEEERKLTVSLPPLAHVQYNRLLQGVWALEDVAVATVKVSFSSWYTRTDKSRCLIRTARSSTGGRTTPDDQPVMPPRTTWSACGRARTCRPRWWGGPSSPVTEGQAPAGVAMLGGAPRGSSCSTEIDKLRRVLTQRPRRDRARETTS